MDLGFIGPSFTWVKIINNSLVNERLVRGTTVNTQWKFMYPNAEIEYF